MNNTSILHFSSILISTFLEFLMNTFGVLFGCVFFALIPTFLLCIPGWLILHRRKYFSKWDVGFPIFTQLFWIIGLIIFHFRGESLVNLLYEPLGIAAFGIILFYVRIFLLIYIFPRKQKQLFKIFLIILFIFSLLLRLFIPALPE